MAEQYTNPRGETAKRNGAIAWIGEDEDETTVGLNELQPLETVFPPCAMSIAEWRVQRIACDCLAGRAPSFDADDDEERKSFCGIWNACTEMKDEFQDIRVHDFVFSAELGVYARDVATARKCDRTFLISFTAPMPRDEREDIRVGPFTIFTDQESGIALPRQYLMGMQLATMVAGGYVKGKVGALTIVSSDGDRYAPPDRTGDAALMIALRRRTPWFADFVKRMPF